MPNRLNSVGQMTPQTAAAFASLQTQVVNIEAEVSQLATSIHSINTKIDGLGKTPWPMYIAGAGFMLSVMVVIGGIAYKPIDTQLTMLTQEVREQGHLIVPRFEHERQWALTESRFERDEKTLESRESKELAAFREAALQRELDNQREWLRVINDTLASLQDERLANPSPHRAPARSFRIEPLLPKPAAPND